MLSKNVKVKNILEVCLSPDLGGLELYMANCSKELAKDFSVNVVISSNSKLKPFFGDLETVEIKRKSSFSFGASRKIAKIIDENKIDIVHIHWTKDIPIVVFAKLLSKQKPKIIQTRHMTMTRFKSDFYHKFLYKNIDTIICVTKALEGQINRFIPQNIKPLVKTIYLGASNPEIYTEEELKIYKDDLCVKDSFMIGFVGRINEFKGQYLLIEAMKKLKLKELNIKAYFVGSAMNEDYLSYLKQKVKDYSLEENVNFLGFTKELDKFMQACDCLVAASKNETFGLVVIEAMKNQTVVITSKSGGFLEIIDDNINGLLFENENADDLALKIEELYNHRDLKDSLVLEAKKKVDLEFDSKIQFGKLREVIKYL